MTTHRRYTQYELHDLLIAKTGFTASAPPERQALFCPFYTRLRGAMSPDWGVVLNPESSRFGLATFEHDWCGCPEGSHGEGRQVVDEWRDRKREPEQLRAIVAEMRERTTRLGPVGGEAGTGEETGHE